MRSWRPSSSTLLRPWHAGIATQLLEAILRTGALPWARFGSARAQVATGAVFQARRTLERLLGDQPRHADEYDVMGRELLHEGQLGQAIEALGSASALTPNCDGRRIQPGLLHLYYGDPREALVHLDAAAHQGLNRGSSTGWGGCCCRLCSSTARTA